MGEGRASAETEKLFQPNRNQIRMATPKGKGKSSSASLSSTQFIPKTSKWSPLSDAIVGRKEGMSEQEQMMKIDQQIESFLYGKGKSSLPVFDKLCREKCYFIP